ncbi:longitudinals lacking protein, isoforms A/B/D/L-like [Copidosoma floridanum]|nr:longitudinals lacking protein, isoforms A/B/D/L-like [Copidosoma floridanum]
MYDTFQTASAYQVVPSQELLVHIDRSMNPSKTNVCTRCGKAYYHVHHLMRHAKFECGISPRFRCFYCSHRSKHKHDLKKHIESKHKSKPVHYYVD